MTCPICGSEEHTEQFHATTSFPIIPAQTSGELIDPKWKIPVNTTDVAKLNVYFAEVKMSDVRRAIDDIRTKQDLFAVIEGETTLHLMTGDIKKMGIWGLIVLIVKIITKFI
jgi:hypothetical protein